MAQGPLPRATAWRAVARCVRRSLGMLARREVRQPDENVGRTLVFGNGTSGRVYRETAVPVAPRSPCLLVVSFRLRGVRGVWHRLFRCESLLNTPLFVGFPGFVSKLWLAHDQNGVYRGVYEWDGPEAAEEYARSLWRVLELVSEPGSIDFRVVPGVRRDAVLADPGVLDGTGSETRVQWWRVVAG